MPTQSGFRRFHSTLHPYTTILHSATRLAKGLKPRDHMTSALPHLHWLPIKARITYKICLMMFNINSGSSSRYMPSLVTPCNQIQSRTNLWSSTKGNHWQCDSADYSNTLPLLRPSGTNYQLSFVKRHLLRLSNPDSKLTCSKFITADWTNIVKRHWVRLDFS